MKEGKCHTCGYIVVRYQDHHPKCSVRAAAEKRRKR